MKKKLVDFFGIIIGFFLLIGFAISCLFALFRKPDNKKVNEVVIKPQDLKFSYKYKFTSATAIKKSHDNKYFATAGSSIAIWDAHTGKKITSFGQLKNPSHLNFSNSGKMLVAKNTSGKVVLFDMDELKHLKSYTPTKSEGCEIYFTPDDKYLVSADWDGYIYTIDIESGKTKILRSDIAVYQTEKVLMFERKVLKSERMMYHILHFDRVSNKYSFYTYDKGLVWKYPFDENNPIIIKYDKEYRQIAYSRANKCYAAVWSFGYLFVVDEQFNKLKDIVIKNIKGKNASVENIAWSPDGKILAVIADKGQRSDRKNEEWLFSVQLLKYPELNFLEEYIIPFAQFIEFTQDGKQLLIGGSSKSFCVDLTGKEKTEHKPERQIDIETYIEQNGLTKELISQVDETEFIEAMFFVSEKIYGNIEHKSESDWVEKLPLIYKLAHLIYWFDNETSEGGLSQYIFNSQCELCAQLKEAFKVLELPEHIKIINKAVKLYNSEELDMYDIKWEKLNEQCEELDENPIDTLYKYICSIIKD